MADAIKESLKEETVYLRSVSQARPAVGFRARAWWRGRLAAPEALQPAERRAGRRVSPSPRPESLAPTPPACLAHT